MDHTSPDDAPERAAGAHPGRPAADPRTEPRAGTSRRHVLGLAVVAGAGLPLLSACGGSGQASTSGGAGSPSSAASSSEAAGPLVATSKVPINGGVILDARKIVVTQPSEGTFKAFTAVCTHQACLVGSVKDGVISCPCHGSAFSAADGSVQNGPASQPLKEIPVTVEGADVVET